MIVDRLETTFDMKAALVAGLGDETMDLSLQEPSNSIWEQFWCVVGARESYAMAI
jgi:hypothetical protein